MRTLVTRSNATPSPGTLLAEQQYIISQTESPQNATGSIGCTSHPILLSRARFAASNPLSDSFVIPASSGSSGVWQVKIYESSANTNCATAIYSATPLPNSTVTFDVARTVVIGAAPSPAPLGGGGGPQRGW
jgi:hypothetical protein